MGHQIRLDINMIEIVISFSWKKCAQEVSTNFFSSSSVNLKYQLEILKMWAVNESGLILFNHPVSVELSEFFVLGQFGFCRDILLLVPKINLKYADW